MPEIKRLEEVSETDVFIGVGKGDDIRRFAFWRLGDKPTGTAIQVKPPQMIDVEENGVKSGTFFGLQEEVRVVCSLPQKP